MYTQITDYFYGLFEFCVISTTLNDAPILRNTREFAGDAYYLFTSSTQECQLDPYSDDGADYCNPFGSSEATDIRVQDFMGKEVFT